MNYKKQYHSEMMDIPIGPSIAYDLILNINDKDFSTKGLSNNLYKYLLKSLSSKYIYTDINAGSLSSWHHLEDYTRHIEETSRLKYITPFYRQVTNEVMNYHIAIFCQFRLRQPVWHKYTSSRPKPKFYYPFWEKPGKYHDYNPGPYDRSAYYFSNRLRLYLQKQEEFNVTDKIVKVNDSLFIYNNYFVDKKLSLYKKNMENYKVKDIIGSCIKQK